MTATFVETAPRVRVADELRVQVRKGVEREYLRLRCIDRPALLDRFDAADEGVVDPQVARALAITDYRLAAISDFLRTPHEPHSEDTVCENCCVLLDQGDGPQWVVLAALDEGDLPIVASDSALGRAVIGARPGDLVHYPSPSGLRTARVIALESGDHT